MNNKLLKIFYLCANRIIATAGIQLEKNGGFDMKSINYEKEFECSIRENRMLKEATGIYGPSESQEYEISVFNGDLLLPVYDHDKIVAQIPWRGNLTRFDGNTDGLGLVQLEDDLILTVLEDGKATAEIIPPEEAVKLILLFEKPRLLDKFNLREVLYRMVK